MADPVTEPGYAQSDRAEAFGFPMQEVTAQQYPERYGVDQRYSLGMQAKSFFQEGWEESLEGYGVGAALKSVYSGMGGELLSKEQLNAKFPGMSVPFSDSMKEAQAQYLYDVEQDRKQRDWIINNGPVEGPVGIFAARLAASVIANFSPLNFAVNAATGFGVGAAIKGAATIPRLSPYVARFAGINPVAQAAAIGVTENLLQEPLLQAGAANLQQERSIEEGVIGAVGGGIFGAAVFRGIPELYGGIKRRVHGNEAVERLSEEVIQVKAQVAEAQAQADNWTELDELFRSRKLPDTPEAWMAAGLPELPREIRPYDYQPRTAFDGVVYLATTNNAHDVQSAGRNSALVSGDIFLGANVVKLTDNPGVASGVAGSSGTAGRVFEIEAKDWKLVDLDEVLGPLNQHDPFLVGLRDASRDAGFAKGKEVKFWNNRWKEGMTRRDLLNVFKDLIRDGELNEGALDILNDRMKRNGFDGYRYEGFGPDKYGNETWGQSNEIVLFDTTRSGDIKGGLFATKFYDGPVTQTAEPELTESIMSFTREQSGPEARFYYDAEATARIDAETTAAPFEPHDVSELKEIEAELFEMADAMQRQGFFDEEEVAEFKRVRESEAEFEKEAKIMKEAAFCLGGGA